MAVADDKCCMCIKLREGCLIIGYVSLVFLTFVIVTTIDNTRTGDITESTFKRSWTSAASKYLIIAESLISLFFTILLLIGVHLNKRGFIKAYLIFKLVFLILYVIGFFSILPRANLRTIVNELGVVCVTMYVLMVIKNYYFVLSREAEPDIEFDIPESETE